MNYKNLFLIILILSTLVVIGCSSQKEVPLVGNDVAPSGGKVSLAIINPDTDNVTNVTSSDSDHSDDVDGSGIPQE